MANVIEDNSRREKDNTYNDRLVLYLYLDIYFYILLQVDIAFFGATF